MDEINYSITPKYFFKSNLKYLFFGSGIFLFITSYLINGYEYLSFIGLIMIILGIIVTIFISKQYLKIDKEEIHYEEKGVIKDFSKSFAIRFEDIEEAIYLKRQFLIFGGRNPYADADTQTLYNENRIVFKLKDKKSKVIPGTGTKAEFLHAYNIIKKRLEQNGLTVRHWK